MDDDLKVRLLQDSTYQVIRLLGDDGYGGYEDEETLFKDSLSDCEAFIRLSEKGYM